MYYLKEEVKAVGLFLIMLAILMVFASFLGLDSGRGGNPQESYMEEYYE